MNTQTDFSKQIEALVEKCFTENFKNNKLSLDQKFNDLNVTVDRMDIYENGEIMNVVVELDDHNKSILSEIVKDFDSYNELVDLEFNSDKGNNQTDLCSIIDYAERNIIEGLLYDVEDEIFHYESIDD